MSALLAARVMSDVIDAVFQPLFCLCSAFDNEIQLNRAVHLLGM